MNVAKKSCLPALALLLCIAVSGLADKAAPIDALVRKYVALNQFSGAVLAAEGGKVLFKKGYGMANLEWSIPNAPDTKFRIGSVTKQFTSMLVLQLVQEGRLKLDDKAADILPYYRKDTGGRFTVHHLLNHTSGLPNYTNAEFFLGPGRRPWGMEAFVKEFCSGELEFEPGAEYRYSNSGYFVLGAVIKQVTGKSYEQNLRQRILDPLGMTATGYDHQEIVLPGRAAGYERRGEAAVHADYVDLSTPGAAGAMYSTVEDMALWDRALYGDTLLGPELKTRMFTPGLGNYAYGWGVRMLPIGPDKAERTVIRHSGGIPGFSSHIVRVPEERNLVVVMSNFDDHGIQALAEGVLDILYGRTPPDPKRSAAEVLMKTYRAQGLDEVIRQYRDIKAREADQYNVSEGEINLLGYRLLGAGKVDDAIAIFKLNVEAYPQGANTYDSLAEAYMAAGKKEDAIRNYAKSLELDPGNRNALDRLNALMKAK
jgi:CubicO group peptidase (beta-lactamase class C family)